MTDETSPVRTAFNAMQGMLRESGASMRVVMDDGQELTMGAVVPDGISGIISQDPTRKVFPPTEETFEARGEDFLPDGALDDLKNRIVAQWPEFGPLRACPVDILWKKSGGKAGGRLTFGKCNKLSGLAAYYSEEVFTIWIAADHVRDHAFNQYQLEALIYHELSHCGWELDEKTGETTWSVVSHDVTTFFNEITRYGTWTPELRTLRHGYEQLALSEGK